MGIEKMKNRFVRYVLIWLLCGLCHTAAFAYSSDPDAQQSKSWGYQPVYSSSTTQPTYGSAPPRSISTIPTSPKPMLGACR